MSCVCDNCNKLSYQVSDLNFPPSNKPVPHCNMNILGSCKNNSSVIFSNFDSPPKKGITHLNNLPTNTDDFSPALCTRGNVGYTSTDPRLIESIRGTTLILNEPPRDTGISMSDVYKPNNVKQHYDSYNDIEFGQIRYYVNNDISHPYFNPNFSDDVETVGYLQRDPMGGINTVYKREVKYRNPCENNSGKFKHCLSFMEDSNAQREDIMAKQMYTMNKSRWSSRYGRN